MPFGNKNTEKKQKSKSHLDLGILAPRPSVAKQPRGTTRTKKNIIQKNLKNRISNATRKKDIFFDESPYIILIPILSKDACRVQKWTTMKDTTSDLI